MKAANALNFLLAVALVLMSAKLFFATAPTPAPTAVAEPDSDGPVRDFHEGHTLPEPPAKPASASDFALAALGADASALPVPKADAVTTATPHGKGASAVPDETQNSADPMLGAKPPSSASNSVESIVDTTDFNSLLPDLPHY